MKRILGAVALASLITGCIGIYRERVAGSGPFVNQTRSVAAFHGIEVDGTPQVQVTVGPSTSVTIRAQQNIADLIDTTVADGTLKIEDKKPYSSAERVIVRITMPELDTYTINGSSDATIAGAKGPELALSIQGAGDITGSGKVDRLTLESNGAGNASLRDLEVRDAVVKVNGVGNAAIDVTGTLDVTIAGVGSVTYRGSPRIVHRTINGVGNVSQE